MQKNIICLFIVLSSIGISFGQNPYENYKTKWVGKPAPDFRFIDISGKEEWLSDMKGKVVLLNFWFTNCSGCRIEYPGLQTLKNRFRDSSKVEFLSIATDQKEKLMAFLQKNPLNFRHMANAYEISEVVYGVLGYPTNIIIDQEGIIRHIKIGGSPQSADDIEYEMNVLLNK